MARLCGTKNSTTYVSNYIQVGLINSAPTSDPSEFVGYYQSYNCFVVTSVSHASQQTYLAGNHSMCPVLSSGTSVNTSDFFKRALKTLLI